MPNRAMTSGLSLTASLGRSHLFLENFHLTPKWLTPRSTLQRSLPDQLLWESAEIGGMIWLRLLCLLHQCIPMETAPAMPPMTRRQRLWMMVWSRSPYPWIPRLRNLCTQSPLSLTWAPRPASHGCYHRFLWMTLWRTWCMTPNLLKILAMVRLPSRMIPSRGFPSPSAKRRAAPRARQRTRLWSHRRFWQRSKSSRNVSIAKSGTPSGSAKEFQRSPRTLRLLMLVLRAPALPPVARRLTWQDPWVQPMTNSSKVGLKAPAYQSPTIVASVLWKHGWPVPAVLNLWLHALAPRSESGNYCCPQSIAVTLVHTGDFWPVPFGSIYDCSQDMLGTRQPLAPLVSVYGPQGGTHVVWQSFAQGLCRGKWQVCNCKASLETFLQNPLAKIYHWPGVEGVCVCARVCHKAIFSRIKPARFPGPDLSSSSCGTGGPGGHSVRAKSSPKKRVKFTHGKNWNKI